MGGRYVPSLLAAIGDVIEQHMLHIGFLIREEGDVDASSKRQPIAAIQRIGREAGAEVVMRAKVRPSPLHAFAPNAESGRYGISKAAGRARIAIIRAAAEVRPLTLSKPLSFASELLFP